MQKRAREEIDRVVGPDRLPNLDDYANMPYIRCCIKESLRWMPTVVLGVPHAALQDDIYMGYKIPKGAMVINNVWYVVTPFKSRAAEIRGSANTVPQGNSHGPRAFS